MSDPESNQSPHHGQSRTAECDAIVEQIEAYALGALDRFDAGLVEQHVRWCPRCRDEFEDVSRVVHLLPFAVSRSDPSPTLKARLLDRVANDDQSAPYDSDTLPERAKARIPQSPPVSATASQSTRTAASSSWLRFVPPAIIAPLAIVVVVVGAWANSMRLELEDQERADSSQEELAQIVANGGDVRLYSMEPQCTGCTGRGRLGVDVADSVGVVVAWGLNPGQEHEVWCVDKKGGRQMVSRLDVDAEGGAMQAFAFPATMSDYAGVYIAQTDGGATYMTNLDSSVPGSQSATPDS